jgi:hypothetical protein
MNKTKSVHYIVSLITNLGDGFSPEFTNSTITLQGDKKVWGADGASRAYYSHMRFSAQFGTRLQICLTIYSKAQTKTYEHFGQRHSSGAQHGMIHTLP